MPTTIPYDSSLVLGNIVHPDVLNNLKALSAAQAPIDASQDSLNSLIGVRRSLDMTVQELLNLNVPTGDVIKEIDTLNKDIENAAKDYAKAWVDNIAKIKELKSKQLAVHADYESPVDYNRTKFTKLPFSGDSLKMEAQYFSFEENQQSSKSTVSDIKGYISNSTRFLGDDLSVQVSEAATSQVNSQLQNHDIAGTLVITVTCTHKDAIMLAPFVLDVDKAIRVWNKMFPSDTDKIKTNSVSNIRQIAENEETRDEKSFNIISGATYGSCFIGMVHVLNATSTKSAQYMNSVAQSLQAQFKVGAWFENESGGFGVNTSFSNDVKNMLSTQNITSHVSLVAMGSIPSIKSNPVKTAVQEFTKFSPDEVMGNLAELANATSSEQASVSQSAEAALTGAKMMAITNAKITSFMSGLATIQREDNKMLDVNSMITAFEDYIDKCIAGNVGIPINYYLKPITQSQLAEMWIGKYYPDNYVAISGDDVTGKGKQQAQSSDGTDNSQQNQ